MAGLGMYRRVSEAWMKEILPDSLPHALLIVCEWVLSELSDHLGFPHEWLKERIETVFQKSEDAVEDSVMLALNTKSKAPFVWIVVSNGSMQIAETLLRNTLLRSASAGTGFCTNSQDTVYLRKRYDTDSCEYIKSLDFCRVAKIASIKIKPTHNSPDSLHLLSPKVEDVFFDIHSLIRDIDGMHADEALDELCKVLYTKIYDEEMTEELQAYRFQSGTYISNDEVATNIRLLYSDAVQYDARVYGLKIPLYARSRGVFEAQIRLSTPALVRVVEALQDFSISRSHIDVKGRAFQKLYLPTVRAGMGQYFTPKPVIDFMVRIAKPSIQQLILDPFCGSAHFLSACLEVAHQSAELTMRKAWYEFAFGKLHGIEKSDRMVRIAMTDMRLHGDGHSNIRCTDALLPFSNYVDIQPNSFDLVLTNPPFGSILHAATFSQLGDFELLAGRKSIPLEILGLERCVQFLRPGGKLGIVLPEGILVNKNTAYVRDWLKKTCRIRAIISLPVETFAPFGAHIKTSIVFATKRLPEEKRTSNLSVFIGRAEYIGYDASGKIRKENDLLPIADELEKHLLAEGW